MSRRRNNNRKNNQLIDDPDDMNDSDIFSLFSTDTKQAFQAQNKINQKKIQLEKKQYYDIIKQRVQDFNKNKELLKSNGIYKPKENTRKQPSIPPLPPPPMSVIDELNKKNEDGYENNIGDSENPFLGHSPPKAPLPELQPQQKASVGEQYGITVDVPKQPLQTRFIQGVPYGGQVPPWKMPLTPSAGHPYGYPQYPYNGQQFPPVPPQYQPYFPQMPGMMPYDPNFSDLPPDYPGSYQYPVPQGPFTPNPDSFMITDPTLGQTEAVAKQRLMEQSGISIAPPTGHNDFMSRISPQQKLIYTSGIQIEPRTNSYGTAEMKVGGHSFSTTYPSAHLPSTVQTSLGPITIGRQSMTQNSPSQPIEAEKPDKQPLDIRVDGNTVFGDNQENKLMNV